MKKIMLLILLSMFQTAAASTYIVSLDDKLVEVIKIEDFTQPSEGEDSGEPVGESPYTAQELVSVDYLSNSDGLATLDTSTGLEWLDLTQTDAMSINQVESLLNSTFSGWRLATADEVSQLLARYMHQDFYNTMLNGGVTNITNNIPQYNAARSFADLFGETGSSGGFDHSRGFLRSGGQVVMSGPSPYITPAGHGQVYSKYNTSSPYSESVGNALIGVWLVSEGGTTLSSQNDPNINIPVQ